MFCHRSTLIWRSKWIRWVRIVPLKLTARVKTAAKTMRTTCGTRRETALQYRLQIRDICSIMFFVWKEKTVGVKGCGCYKQGVRVVDEHSIRGRRSVSRRSGTGKGGQGASYACLMTRVSESEWSARHSFLSLFVECCAATAWSLSDGIYTQTQEKRQCVQRTRRTVQPASGFGADAEISAFRPFPSHFWVWFRRLPHSTSWYRSLVQPLHEAIDTKTRFFLRLLLASVPQSLCLCDWNKTAIQPQTLLLERIITRFPSRSLRWGQGLYVNLAHDIFPGYVCIETVAHRYYMRGEERENRNRFAFLSLAKHAVDPLASDTRCNERLVPVAKQPSAALLSILSSWTHPLLHDLHSDLLSPLTACR